MHLRLRFIYIFLVLLIIPFNITEWIEISQSHKITTSAPTTKKPIKILQNNKAHIFYVHSTSSTTDNTTPSAEWIAYQKERFGSRKGFNTQQLTITAQKNLKNTAQIIVPAQVQPKNQILRAKTKLEVRPEIEPELTVLQKPPPPPPIESINVETTSRKDTSSSFDNILQPSNDEAVIDNLQETQSSTESNDDDNDNDEDDLQMPSIEGFLKFLKSLKNTWMSTSVLSIEDKINELHNFKNQLMQTICKQT